MPISVKVIGIDGLEIPHIQGKSNSDHELKVGNIFVEVAIYHGGVPLTSYLSSHQHPFKRNIYFSEWLKSNIKVRNIPKARDILFVLRVKNVIGIYVSLCIWELIGCIAFIQSTLSNYMYLLISICFYLLYIQAARLCLVVKGLVKNHPVPLYWVNVQLLDHR